MENTENSRSKPDADPTGFDLPFPIRNLPLEILGEVLKCLQNFDEGFPPSMSLVCSTWRQVILNTPNLWTYIRITSAEGSFDAAQLSLKRAGPTLPLCVIFHEWDRERHTGRPTIRLDWLEPHRPRIQKLSVSLKRWKYQWPLDPEKRIPIIPGDRFDNLEELDLDLTPGDWPTVKCALLKASTKTPRLWKLRIKEMSLPPSDIPIPMDRITHLTLEHMNPSFNLRQLLDFLSSYTHLQSVILAQSTRAYPPSGNEYTGGVVELEEHLAHGVTPEDDRITLPALEVLHIDVSLGTKWLLERLTLPALQELRIDRAVAWEQSFIDLATRSAFPLQHFCMVRCKWALGPYKGENAKEQQVISVLKAAPTIQTLRVSDSLFLSKHLVGKLQRLPALDPLLGPSLQHLWITETAANTVSRGDVEADEEYVLQMLDSRQPGGGAARMQTRGSRFVVYHTGSPSIPVQVMSLQDTYSRYNGAEYAISRHIFF